jgi:hypothetical protein
LQESTAPPDDITEWTPISLRWESSGPELDWRWLNGRRFLEPFFDQTIKAHEKEVRSANRAMAAEALLARAGTAPARPPKGFIFHASYCGSTLVAQMLASLPQNIVLSEPEILNQVLDPKPGACSLTEADQATLFRAVVEAMGRPRHAGEQQYFVKFSSRAIAKMPLIRRAFPDVPWIFLYREPLEIMGAYLRFPSHRLQPGLAEERLIEGDPAELAEMRPEEFRARMVAERFSSAIAFYQADQGLLINYSQLPEAACGCMLKWFATTFSPEDVEHMRMAAARDAKKPAQEFREDSNQYRRAVPDAAHALVNRLVRPHYDRLESIRAGQLGG